MSLVTSARWLMPRHRGSSSITGGASTAFSTFVTSAMPATVSPSGSERSLQHRSSLVLAHRPRVRLNTEVRLREASHGVEVVLGDTTGRQLRGQPHASDQFGERSRGIIGADGGADAGDGVGYRGLVVA